MTRRTFFSIRSTCAVTPSIGCAQARSWSLACRKASTRTIRRRSSSAGARYAPAVIGAIRILLMSVSPRRASASRQSGSAAMISSTRWYSESTIGSWPSAAVSTARALTTVRSVERHHDVGGLAVLQVDQEGAQPPVGGRAAEHLVLGRFLQAVVGEPDRLREQPGGRHDLSSGQVFAGGGRVERMRIFGHGQSPVSFVQNGRLRLLHRHRYSSAMIEPTRSPSPGSRRFSHEGVDDGHDDDAERRVGEPVERRRLAGLTR